MRKKLTAAVLALALILGMISGASAAELARASTQSVEVDGTPVEFQMYALVDENGGLTNYVKLRDVAHVLNSTPAKFSVGYDGTISITTGEAYTSNGSEMSTPYSGDRAYKPGPGAVKVNGADVSLDAIVLTDDNGGAYTYFKLRDLGAALGFKVDWTGERGVFIETGAEAAPVQEAPKTLTMEDVQGIWYYPGGEWDAACEYIFTGDQVKAVIYNSINNEFMNYSYLYYTATCTMESSDAHSGVIKMSGLQQYTVAEDGTETPMESSRTSLSIRKYKDGGLTIGDSGRKSCEPISESRLNREMMSLIEGAAAKREEMEAKYPSYAGYPGVPDAGPIIDRRGRAEAGSAPWSEGMTHYRYAIVEDLSMKNNDSAWNDPVWLIEWQASIDFDPMYEKYRDVLLECGFSERTIHTYGGDEEGFVGYGWVVLVYRDRLSFVVSVQPDD